MLLVSFVRARASGFSVLYHACLHAPCQLRQDNIKIANDQLLCKSKTAPTKSKFTPKPKSKKARIKADISRIVAVDNEAHDEPTGDEEESDESLTACAKKGKDTEMKRPAAAIVGVGCAKCRWSVLGCTSCLRKALMAHQ